MCHRDRRGKKRKLGVLAFLGQRPQHSFRRHREEKLGMCAAVNMPPWPQISYKAPQLTFILFSSSYIKQPTASTAPTQLLPACGLCVYHSQPLASLHVPSSHTGILSVNPTTLSNLALRGFSQGTSSTMVQQPLRTTMLSLVEGRRGWYSPLVCQKTPI